MRKTLLLTVGYLLGIWTFCPAQEQTDETAVVQKAAAATEEYYSGSDRYTSSPQTWSEMKRRRCHSESLHGNRFGFGTRIYL